MAKKYRSGVYLGETRRQRTVRIRNFCLIAAMVVLYVIASLCFVSWLLDRTASSDAGAASQTPSAQIQTAVSDTEGLPLETETETAEAITEAVTEAAAVPVTGRAYKPLYFTRQWSVMIDPGHGFDDIGASSALLGEVNEATINLDIALRVKQILTEKEIPTSHVSVIMTHEDNAVDGRISAADGGEPPLNNLVLLTPEDRAVLGNGQDIDLFVSIHCDSLPSNPAVSGMRVYYCDSGDTQDALNLGREALATNIANQFGLQMGKDAPTPLVKTMSDDNAFYVIKKLNVPSVLCEVGFITNEGDAANMLDEQWRQAAAEGIAKGILGYIYSGMGRVYSE